MILPQRLADGSGYVLQCQHCHKGYSVETKNLDGADPQAPADLSPEPLPKGCTTNRFVDGKIEVTFTCPNCGIRDTIHACKNC